MVSHEPIITYTLSLSNRFIADLEKSIVSVERIKEYQKTPQEAPFEIPHQVG